MGDDRFPVGFAEGARRSGRGTGVVHQDLFAPAKARGLCVGLTTMEPSAETMLIQHSMDESVHVVSEGLEMLCSGECRSLRSGDFIMVPAGAWHAFRNVSDRDASMLFFFLAPSFPPTRRRRLPRPWTGSHVGGDIDDD